MSNKLYQTVFQAIIQSIVDGEYPPGAMLPNEFDLGAKFGVSQGTARKALIELEKKRIIERHQGRGSFVTQRTPENSLFHFFRLRDKNGEQVTPELHTEAVRRRKAFKAEKEALYGAPDDVYEIKRVRNHHGKPLCQEISLVPTALFPGLHNRAPLPNTLYVLFQRAYSCAIISAEDQLKASTLDKTLALELGQAEGTPVIIAERRSFDLLERVVELRTTVILTHNAHYFVSMN